ncbi:MAG: right-handed parallel beta-helix repeat-containing protein [Planctomycetes bacterium]|nr:right-handed parallel beta-helix repeat-containing protein [Planctomycetota bacterium]
MRAVPLPRPRPGRGAVPALLFAIATGGAAPAQATVIALGTNDEPSLRAAIVAANALAFQTSPANPVVIELAPPTPGNTTITLTQALPLLLVDHVTLRPAGATPATRVTIDAGTAPTAFRIASRHAAVRNVRFRLPPGITTQEDVFTAFGTEHLTLVDCDFEGATGNGLWLIGALSTSVQNCGFQDNAAALVATGGTRGLTVTGCSFQANQQAMLFAVADQATVGQSTFVGNGLVLALQPVCADVTFGPGNLVQGTTALPALVASGAVRLQVLGNQFHDNLQAAIQLKDLCVDATLADNELLRNGLPGNVYQLVVQDSHDVRVRGLVCRDGGGGVFATATTAFDLRGNAPGPTAITGNRREGVVLTGCTGAVVDQIALAGNLTAVASAQVAVLGGGAIDLTALQIGAATGPGRIGVRIDGSAGVRFGRGSTVLDQGGQGVLVANAADVVLGAFAGGPGSLFVRGPLALQVTDSLRVAVAGTAAAPCLLQAGPVPTGIAVFLSGGADSRIGPHLTVDGAQTASTAIQVANTPGSSLHGTTLRGHTARGLVAVATPGLAVRECTVEGALGTGSTDEGILVNAGCHGARLFGNLVRRQQGAAFFVVDSDDVWLGPGNRALDNAGDGFVVWDTGSSSLPASRRATLQSAVAVGRGLAGQSGVRCVHVLANVTNATATAHGTGVLLQAGAVATIVNTISWGNGLDRNRDPVSTGNWWHGLRASSGGVGGPGAWTEQGMLLGTNPLFANVAAGDVRLLPGSPAIDSGLHATPIGAGLPCADALLADRIRGGVIDRGAVETVPAVGTGNALDLAGPWLRPAAQSQLDFTVRGSPAQAGQLFLLAVSGSGTGPALAVAGDMPLVADGLSAALLSIPAWCLGVIDGSGLGTVSVPLPPFVVPFLPEMTFAAAIDIAPPPTNPVVVRFLP